MKSIIFLGFILLSLHTSAQYKSLHDFSAKTLDGKDFEFARLKGKKVLIVNTASECALTPQFKKLQELYEEYGGDQFEIIGFPCNDFGGQEPNTNENILEFCTKKYGVTFQMMERITIDGEGMHPLYKWLTSSSDNGSLDSKVKWNFQKYLIDENGQIVDVIPPIGGVKSNRIMDWLKQTE